MAAFVVVAGLALPFPWIVGVAGLAGWAAGRWKTHASSAEANAGPALQQASKPRALIDDDTPRPPHTRFSWCDFGQALMVGGGLWLLTMGWVVAMFGWRHTLTEMGWFFTKAALLTFGGAYAVLPYVYQAAVEQFGWLTAGQMIDGLALGETTFGPLIMVVVFVAYLGVHAKAALGPDVLVWGGILAALLVTWLTFSPSFIFILAGGPLVESTRGEAAVQGALKAISAAVVGVIVSLAWFFVKQVLWNSGGQATLNVEASIFLYSPSLRWLA